MSENEPHNKDDKDDKSEEGTPTFVTPLASMAEQIGQHVMTALSHGGAVAVVTTVTGSRTGKKVVSMPLNAQQMGDVHRLLAEIEASDVPEEIDCVGFHCTFGDDDEAK